MVFLHVRINDAMLPDTSSSGHIKACMLVMLFSKGKVLLRSLLGTHIVFTQPFSNRHIAMRFLTMKKEALEYMQSRYRQWCIILEVLGGNLLIAIS